MSHWAGQKVPSNKVSQDHLHRVHTQLPRQECTNSADIQRHQVPSAPYWSRTIWWTQNNPRTWVCLHEKLALLALDLPNQSPVCCLRHQLHAMLAARDNTWLLIKLTPKDVVSSFLWCCLSWPDDKTALCMQRWPYPSIALVHCAGKRVKKTHLCPCKISGYASSRCTCFDTTTMSCTFARFYFAIDFGKKPLSH